MLGVKAKDMEILRPGLIEVELSETTVRGDHPKIKGPGPAAVSALLYLGVECTEYW